MTIRIRGIEIDDAADMVDLLSQPKCINETGFLPYPTLHAWQERIRCPKDDRKVLVAEVEDKVVGYCDLTTYTGRYGHIGMIGIMIHDGFHRRGVGRALMEAIVDLGENWLGLRRLELKVNVDNHPAIRLYKSLGFEEEGIARDVVLRAGCYVDAVMMARLNRPD